MEGEMIGESSGSNSSNNALPTENIQPKTCSVPSSGRFKGVVPQQNGHWGAQIYTRHQRIWLGTFKTETEAAMAYDSAAIKIRSGDSYRNIPWTSITIQEPDFQAQYTTEAVLNMIKDGSYQSKFADFLRNHSQSTEEEAGASLVEGHAADGKLSCKQLFQKELTPSDVGKLNRLVIPKKYAVKYFPPISAASPEENEDGSTAEDVELVFFDRFMKLWKFRYCYWSSSQSYVFTRGWNSFVREKDLKANETITFLLCERRGVEQNQKFCMIDVDRDQINKVPAEGNSQNVVMLVELQLALRSGAQDHDEVENELKEGHRVVEMEGLDLRLALRPSLVDDGSNLIKEVEVTENYEIMNLELQLALRPSAVCDEKKLEEEEARDAEGFTLFGVQMKRQCLREGF